MGRLKTNPLQDRVQRLHNQLTQLRRAEDALEQDFVALTERAAKLDQPTAFGGLGGYGSSTAAGNLGRERGQAGALSAAVSAADMVEAYLAQYRLDRTRAEDRQKALDAVLAARPDYDLLLSDADKVRIVANLAANPEVDSGPELRSGAPVQTTERLSEATRAAWGGHQAEAEELGGGDLGEGLARFHIVESLLRKHGLRKNRPRDYERVLELLYDRVNPTADVKKAITFDEARWALAKNHKLSLAEANEQAADLANAVRRLRPDLVTDFRAGRDTPSPGRKPHDDDDDDDETLKLVEARAREELRAQDAPCTEENLRRAKIAVARLHPELVPGTYGRGRK